ncbi:unnamed protein product [Schistosoma mattheei]|uniref:Uncharacterized protein n=1 Tax=Schistosoma mattheei TaxID=31246 RepID=A0A3P8JBT5_9TREM|nr:unnamed protein product [Schistosoma mattheei]
MEPLTTNNNMTTNTTRTSRKEEGAAAAASDDEDDEKIQQIIKLFRNHFMVHINEFENKVTSITERLNLEVNQMQTFKIYAHSLIEKINATESKQKSLLLSDYNNQRILKHLDISNAIRNKMQQFIEDSRKKKRALCLRIVLLKRKLNFFEYEVEKLRKENNNLKENVSIAEYERVCMAYKDLYRRHQEYERIILNSDNQKFIIKSNDFQ